MGKWLRLDALWRQHPKMITVGYWPSTLVQAAWEACKAFDGGGDVTQFWSPAYLVRWTGAPLTDMEQVKRYMEQAEQAGLIQVEGGKAMIHDWEDHQPESSTERVRKHRAKKKLKQVKQPETVIPVSCNEVTPNRTGQDGTGQDQQDKTPPRKGKPKKPSSKAAQCLARWWGERHPYWQGKSYQGELRTWEAAIDKLLADHTELEFRDLAQRIFADNHGGNYKWAPNCRSPRKLTLRKQDTKELYWDIIDSQLTRRGYQGDISS